MLLSAKKHIDRLFEGAKALAMDLGCDKQRILDELYRACDANEMKSDVHIRAPFCIGIINPGLVVSRGLKPTPYQNPKTTIGLPTVVIIPEFKAALSDETSAKVRGITLFTAHVRRGPADIQDPMWNSLSKLNCIAACIQANAAGADEALMLDTHGFVATCNSTNFFIVRSGEVWTPTTK